MSEILEIRREGRVLRLVLNRPEKRNALNASLCRELVTALDEAEQDRAIGAVLLSANGKAFCSGMDLHEVASSDVAGLGNLHEQVFTVGLRITKPIVAAVHGPALAGGTGLIANAHIVVAADDATFGLTEIRIGLWPFFVFGVVSMAIGERRAVELSLSGRVIDAREAQQFGLVHHVVPAADLEARAREIAAGLARASAQALRSGLAFVHEIRGHSWKEAAAAARRIREQVFANPDFAEGVKAFREKRQPRWPSLDE